MKRQAKKIAKSNGTLDELEELLNAKYFERHYSGERGKILELDFSSDFKRWRALVRFEDGYECWTYPQWPQPIHTT